MACAIPPSSPYSVTTQFNKLNKIEQQLNNICQVKNRHYYTSNINAGDIKSTVEEGKEVTAFSKKIAIEKVTEVSKTGGNLSVQGEDFQELKALPDIAFLLLSEVQNVRKAIREAAQADTPENRKALQKHLENIKEKIEKLPEDPTISLPSKTVKKLNNLYIALNNEPIEFGKLFLMGALLVIGVALKMLMSWPFVMISLVAVLCSCVLLRGSVDRQSEKITQQIADYEYKVVVKQTLSQMLGAQNKISVTVDQLMKEATTQKEEAKKVFEDQIKQFYNSDKASRLEKGKLITALRKSIDAWHPTEEELFKQLAQLMKEATTQKEEAKKVFEDQIKQFYNSDKASRLEKGKLITALRKSIDAWHPTEEELFKQLAPADNATAFLAKINDPFEKYGGAEDRAGNLKAAKDIVIFLQEKLHTIRSKDSQALIHTLDQVIVTAENELDKLNQSAVKAASRQLRKEIAAINKSVNKAQRLHRSKFPEIQKLHKVIEKIKESSNKEQKLHLSKFPTTQLA